MGVRKGIGSALDTLNAGPKCPELLDALATSG